MAKARVKQLPVEVQKDKKVKEKEKERKNKNGKALVGRVKKVIKKSRRKLSEEKFEKQLQRTIAFLEELQTKLNESNNSSKKPKNKKEITSSPPKKTKTARTSVKPAVASSSKTNQ